MEKFCCGQLVFVDFGDQVRTGNFIGKRDIKSLFKMKKKYFYCYNYYVLADINVPLLWTSKETSLDVLSILQASLP